MSKLTKIILIILTVFAFSSGVANTIYALFVHTTHPNVLLVVGMFSFLMAYLLNEEIILHEQSTDDETF